MNITTDASKRRFWKIAGLSFFLGLLLAATFAPLHIVFLLPISFSGLLILLSYAQTRKQAFFIGWWFGWGQFIAGLYWIGIAFTIDAEAHAALIPLPTLGLPAVLAIFSGLATLATHLTKAKGLCRILAFTGFWVLFEYGRGYIFTGFPWNLAGYSWGNILPMMQWVSYIGIYGLTLFTVLICSIPSLLTDKSLKLRYKNSVIILDCLLLAAMLAIGYARIPTNPLPFLSDNIIRIVQPNILQAEKWKSAKRFSHIKKLTELSSQAATNPPRHLIWPETAVPFFLTTDEQLKFYLLRIVPQMGTLITGAPRKNPQTREYWNSVHVLEKSGDISGIYDKQHLVPYGEYMPLRNLMRAIGLTSLIPVLDQMSDFSLPADPDSARKVLEIQDLGVARILICYEVAFPWEVASKTQFDWILNVTNDAWFGNTSGPYQHLVTTRARAIEQGTSVVRAANSGISAIIDGYGRILQEIPLNQAGFIDGSIPEKIQSRTLYNQFGESIPLSLAIILVAFGFIKRRSKTP